MMSRAERAEIEARARRAWEGIVAACKRVPPSFTMSIPADEERDLDLLVGRLTDTDIPRLLADLAAMELRCTKLENLAACYGPALGAIAVGVADAVGLANGAVVNAAVLERGIESRLAAMDAVVEAAKALLPWLPTHELNHPECCQMSDLGRAMKAALAALERTKP